MFNVYVLYADGVLHDIHGLLSEAVDQQRSILRYNPESVVVISEWPVRDFERAVRKWREDQKVGG